MPDGFFKGELYGKVGLVPSNFVQLILDQGESVTDETSQQSGPAKFVALYDYNPGTQSPNENPETELAFCEGDIIMITGPMDEVNYYFSLLLVITLHHPLLPSTSSPPSTLSNPSLPRTRTTRESWEARRVLSPATSWLR